MQQQLHRPKSESRVPGAGAWLAAAVLAAGLVALRAADAPTPDPTPTPPPATQPAPAGTHAAPAPSTPSTPSTRPTAPGTATPGASPATPDHATGAEDGGSPAEPPAPRPPSAADTLPPDGTLQASQQKYWLELRDTQGADRLWTFYKSEYRGTVLLTQTDQGGNKLADIIDKVLDQLDKQFGLKPEKIAHQFLAANTMGFKVVYQATVGRTARYQVQYFIPKNEHLYVLTCSCKKGMEDGISFDGFADAFVPPVKK
ncbi:MAG: hypothetical protein ACREJ2_17165 [Planctomycetota bacterium]